MPQIELVILDLDDTLCDYASAKAHALADAARVLATPNNPAEDIVRRYLKYEPALFKQFAGGGLDIADYRRLRFRQSVSGKASDEVIDAANAAYMEGANLGVRLFPDALPLLQDLMRRGLGIAILTNGPSDGQRTKLKVTGLDVLVQAIFISAETGFSKPDRQAFMNVVDSFSAPMSACLMVGDDFGNDIEPARKMGMAALHLVRGAPLATGRISALSEVVSFLE